MARLFLLTGIDAELSVRIPSVLAAVFTMYHFHRLCRSIFPVNPSLLLTALLAANPVFLKYAASGRGYAFVFLFTVLFLRASIELNRGDSLKWWILLVISEVLGLFTMPSFPLIIPVPVLAIFLRQIISRQWISLLCITGSQCVAVLLIGLAYSGILLSGHRHILLHPEVWGNRFVFGESWFMELTAHWCTVVAELFGSAGVFPVLMGLCGALVLSFRRGADSRLLWMLLITTFFPVVYILSQGVYPFSRSLSNFVVPILLATGFVLSEFIRKRPPRSRVHPNMTFLLPLILLLYLVFHQSRSRATTWEDKIDRLRAGREELILKTRSLACTDIGQEYYARDLLGFIVSKESGHPVPMTSIDSVLSQDIVVIDSSVVHSFSAQLSRHRPLIYHENTYVFGAASLVAEQ